MGQEGGEKKREWGGEEWRWGGEVISIIEIGTKKRILGRKQKKKAMEES